MACLHTTIHVFCWVSHFGQDLAQWIKMCDMYIQQQYFKSNKLKSDGKFHRTVHVLFLPNKVTVELRCPGADSTGNQIRFTALASLADAPALHHGLSCSSLSLSLNKLEMINLWGYAGSGIDAPTAHSRSNLDNIRNGMHIATSKY